MTDKEIIMALPKRAPIMMTNWAVTEHRGHFGNPPCIFYRDSQDITEYGMPSITTWQDREEMRRRAVRKHVARCTCGACGEDFIAGWTPNDHPCGRGIIISVGEDGLTYPGYVTPEDDFTEFIHEGELLTCPICCCEIELVHKSKMRKGRTTQLMVYNLEVVCGCAAIIYWLVRRNTNEDGICMDYAAPAEAIVLDGKQLKRFSHIKPTMYNFAIDAESWERRCTIRNPLDILYYNYGSINHRCMGGCVYNKVIPSLAGTSGEKTGLEDFFFTDGEDPTAYLQVWKRHPNIENLVKAGWSKCVSEALSEMSVRGFEKAFDWVDWNEAKPHKMLGMSKSDIKAELEWCLEEMRCYRRFRATGQEISAEEFDNHILNYSLVNLKELISLTEKGYAETELKKVIKYLNKQTGGEMQRLELGDAAMRMFVDYRRMLESLDRQGLITEEELWPRDLRAAHDRMADLTRNSKSLIRDASFKKVKEQYKALEWTDGSLCVVIPNCNADLVNEGIVLRHCVGGYGESHISGRPIFFVRRYRRPERSYYTLNEDLTGQQPWRIQLHGYGNERHGENKQYEHRIPQKVLDFCNRWEREVLVPWFRQQKMEAKK